MPGIRVATLEDSVLLTTIAAQGFFDDPVMSWVFPERASRLEQLNFAFAGLVRGFLPDRGTVHVIEESTAAFWRAPGFDHGSPDNPERDGGAGPETLFPVDVRERLAILGAALARSHPHDPHWYLNVLSTIPARQGHGLGACALRAMLDSCDAEGIPAYLESSNPRNMTLYRRHGFAQTAEVPLPDGPSLYPMWRGPRP